MTSPLVFFRFIYILLYEEVQDMKYYDKDKNLDKVNILIMNQ